MKQTICTAVGMIGSAIASVFGGWDAGTVTLLIFMAIDYVSGLVVAGVFHKSNKTDTGSLESKAGWKGLCRKCMTLVFVIVAPGSNHKGNRCPSEEIRGRMMYNDTRWKRKRASVLRRDAYQCQECRRYGKRRQGEHVHHVFPVEYYPDERYNDCNLITLCQSCHNKMHDRDSHELTAQGKQLQMRMKKRYGSRLPPL